MSTALDRVCLAGWASADITPDVPCWMAGHAGRPSPAVTVHEPLHGHALALGTPSNALIVVVCDLLAVEEGLVEAVRDRVQAQRPGASVWLSATHTPTSSGKRLHGLADVVIDNCGPLGDALLERGHQPPVLISANVPGGREAEEKLRQQYVGRIRQ